MDADAIDLSKENIQPLRHGRKAHLLGLALQAQTDCDVQQKLLKKRDEFEMLIRMYDGPDPLKPRYDYVLWLEQSYPKHGKESNLIPLLEDTITVFKDDEQYHQDPRFIELIIKFIETQVNPLELFQVVFNLGIGTMCSLLYKSWADELDSSGDVKRADQIYKLGISNNAQPLEFLKQEHKQFQLSVGRRLISGEELSTKDETATTNQQRPRQVLGKLKSKVGSLRPTFGKAGVVPLCLSNRNDPSNSNVPISIYYDNVSSETPVNNVENYRVQCLPKSDLAKKENSLKPGPWSKSYKTPRNRQVYTPSTPSFKVHQDCEPSTPMTPMSLCPSALKTRKGDTLHFPVAIFEPHDPSVQPMYCKSKIYVGGREFQFEEIQAAIYYKKLREKIQKDELDKLGIKMTNLSCLTTPQALRKDSKEISTPFCKDKQDNLPFVSSDKVGHSSQWESEKKKEVEMSIPSQSSSRLDPKTPSRHLNFEATTPFQPPTPFDLPSEHVNEIVMEGASTSMKLPPPPPPSPKQETSLINKQSDCKPVESTSNVKKFLNFSVYCDDN